MSYISTLEFLRTLEKCEKHEPNSLHFSRVIKNSRVLIQLNDALGAFFVSLIATRALMMRALVILHVLTRKWRFSNFLWDVSKAKISKINRTFSKTSQFWDKKFPFTYSFLEKNLSEQFQFQLLSIHKIAWCWGNRLNDPMFFSLQKVGLNHFHKIAKFKKNSPTENRNIK